VLELGNPGLELGGSPPLGSGLITEGIEGRLDVVDRKALVGRLGQRFLNGRLGLLDQLLEALHHEVETVRDGLHASALGLFELFKNRVVALHGASKLTHRT
jgi:hypothetical protein